MPASAAAGEESETNAGETTVIKPEPRLFRWVALRCGGAGPGSTRDAGAPAISGSRVGQRNGDEHPGAAHGWQ